MITRIKEYVPNLTIAERHDNAPLINFGVSVKKCESNKYNATTLNLK